MQNRIQHAVGPLDLSAGQFLDALNDRVTVTIAFAENGEYQGHGGGGHQFLFKFHGFVKYIAPQCMSSETLEGFFFSGPKIVGSRGREGVVVGMTSNGFTLADPNDREMLDVLVSTRLCRP